MFDFDDTIFEAFLEIKRLLREKYPEGWKRFLFLLLAIVISITPIFLFEFWLGGISGVLLVSVFLFIAASSLKQKREN